VEYRIGISEGMLVGFGMGSVGFGEGRGEGLVDGNGIVVVLLSMEP
jgi:hypothetical protein